MAFLKAIKSGFRNYFQHKGRSTRPEFWWFALFVFGVGAGLLGLNLWFDGRLFEVSVFENGAFGFVSFSVLWGIIMLSPTLAVMVRRLRDAGRDIQALWILFPVVGWLILAVHLCAPSIPNSITSSHKVQTIDAAA